MALHFSTPTIKPTHDDYYYNEKLLYELTNTGASQLTYTLEVVPRVITSPLVSSTGSPQCLLPESGLLIG